MEYLDTLKYLDLNFAHQYINVYWDQENNIPTDIVVTVLKKDGGYFIGYGVTLEEHGLEFCYVQKDKYSNFHPIVGDYMDLSIWPKDVDLKKTDLFYIDGLHEEMHLRAELNLYKPFFKKGAIILFDDIFKNPGMARVWHDLENILDVGFKTTLPLHWTGGGLLQIKKDE